jgi:hypothetical protein
VVAHNDRGAARQRGGGSQRCGDGDLVATRVCEARATAAA